MAVQKVVIHRAGGYERLRLESHPHRSPGPEEVAVEVHGIGVNYADCVVRMGLYRSAREYVGWPVTPGFEVAGVVARVGDEVDDLKVGSKVVAVTRFDGYASEVVVPRRQVFPCPANLSLIEAAGVPVAFLTAYYALVELARARPNSRVLIHSAGGGVGLAAVQIARWMGCEVVGVVGSGDKLDVVRRYGAQVAIDKSQQSLWQRASFHAPAGYDAILDANGVSTLKASFAHLAPTGRLVVYGFHSMLPRHGRPVRWWSLLWNYLRTPRFSPFDLTDRNRSVMGFNLSYLFDHNATLTGALGQITQWLEREVVKPLPTHAVALADVAEAHRALESGATVGKLVLVPEGRG